jgi:YebC/PmpR family DNA-binding regulatory protein
MAGHSHWKQIKTQKSAADAERSRIFSKLLNSIAIAAREETNPQFNARLRAAIEKAKEYKVPQENIERAIKRAALKENNLEELIIEAYGPGGAAIAIEAITDNRNRTLNEIKEILRNHDAKLGEPGSVRWAFLLPEKNETEWKPKFTQAISGEDKNKLNALIEALEQLETVQKVYTNAQ